MSSPPSLLLLPLLVLHRAAGQDLSCPAGSSSPPTPFLVIGASGGDSKAACENTAAATRAGLANGITAVELDLSMSQDKVVFLWNDPNPLEPTAQARSQGLFVNGLCRPVYGGLGSARGQVFSKILQTFAYVNSSGVDQYATIPTLHEWMNEFAADPRLQLIVLDIKLVEVEQADYLVEHIMVRADKLGAASKIRLLSPSYSMVAGLQSALARAGWDKDMASRVLGGTVGTIHLGHDSTAGFDPVASAVEGCYGLASVGQSVSSNGWREFQEIVERMVATRDEQAAQGAKYIPIFVWRINTVAQMAWLMCSGVDGLYTDEPRQLSVMALRQVSGEIVCCSKDLALGCLTPGDARVAGQGCASLGQSWATLPAEPCSNLPFPFDFFQFGHNLTCRQSGFVRMGEDENCN